MLALGHTSLQRVEWEEKEPISCRALTPQRQGGCGVNSRFRTTSEWKTHIIKETQKV